MSGIIIRILAKAGADLYSLTNTGLTPLSLAIKNENTVAVMVLLGELLGSTLAENCLVVMPLELLWQFNKLHYGLYRLPRCKRFSHACNPRARACTKIFNIVL
jgi:hypothetical protein